MWHHMAIVYTVRRASSLRSLISLVVGLVDHMDPIQCPSAAEPWHHATIASRHQTPLAGHSGIFVRRDLLSHSSASHPWCVACGRRRGQRIGLRVPVESLEGLRAAVHL